MVTLVYLLKMCFVIQSNEPLSLPSKNKNSDSNLTSTSRVKKSVTTNHGTKPKIKQVQHNIINNTTKHQDNPIDLIID